MSLQKVTWLACTLATAIDAKQSRIPVYQKQIDLSAIRANITNQRQQTEAVDSFLSKIHMKNPMVMAESTSRF